MMKLVFLALLSTAFCGILVEKVDFNSIADQLGDDVANTQVQTETKVTTQTKVTPESKVDRETNRVYQRVEKVFNNDKKLKEELMKLKDINIIENVRLNFQTYTTSETLRKTLNTLVSQSSNNRDAVTKALLLFRWNVMSQKLFELTKKLSLVIKECKFSTFQIIAVIKDAQRSHNLLTSLENRARNKCLVSKTRKLWNQLNADDSVHNVDEFIMKSFITVCMKEFVAQNGMELTHHYNSMERVVSLKKVITKSKLPIYVTLDVIYTVCRGHYSMFQDEVPSEVSNVAAAVCRYTRNKTFETVMLVSYLYKEQLN